MQERQFDGVPDLLDLAGQAADVGVVDVRGLLQQQVGQVAARHDLEGEPDLAVGQQRHARTKLAHVAGEGQHDVLVRGPADQHAGLVQPFFEHHHLAGQRAARDPHQQHRLVEQHRRPRTKRLGRHVRAQRDPQQPAADGHVRHPLGRQPQQRGQGERRPGQLVQLGAKAQQALPRLAQGLVQLLVLLRQRPGVGPGVRQPPVGEIEGAAARLQQPARLRQVGLEGGELVHHSTAASLVTPGGRGPA